MRPRYFGWNRRTAELTLTFATGALLLASAAAERVPTPPVVHLAIDVAAYVTGGWFASAVADSQALRAARSTSTS